MRWQLNDKTHLIRQMSNEIQFEHNNSAQTHKEGHGDGGNGKLVQLVGCIQRGKLCGTEAETKRIETNNDWQKAICIAAKFKCLEI